MNQTILFLRSAQVYNSKAAALAGIAAVEHKAGQPVVAFFEETVNEVKTTRIAFAIGNGNGVGKYNLLATEADYSELVNLFELHVENFDTHISKVANGSLGHVKKSDYITFDETGAGELVDNSVDLGKLQKIAAKRILGNAGDAGDDVAELTAEEVFGIIAAEVANKFKFDIGKKTDTNQCSIQTTFGSNDSDVFFIDGGNGVTLSTKQVTSEGGAVLGTSIVINVDSSNFSVDKANEAAKISTPRDFSITGDDYINGTESSVSFDGTDNVKLAISLDKDALAAAILTDVKAGEVKEEGKAIVSISQADGIVSASAGSIAAEYVDIKDENEYFTATTVEGALAELYSQAGAGSKVTMTSANVEEEDGEGNKVVVAKEYKFYQGGEEDEKNLIGSINIAKDLVVNKGELVEREGEQYIVLELNDIDKTKIEVKVTDLVDTYTGSKAITINESNVISLITADYFTQDNNKLELNLGTSLKITPDKKINVNYKSDSGLYEVAGDGLAIKIKDGEGYITTDSNGLQTTQDLQDALNAWKNITVNGNSFDTTEGSTDITVGADDVEYLTGTSVAEELDRINNLMGKVSVSNTDSTQGYLADKILSGESNTSTNTYGVTVTENSIVANEQALKLTVKIDTIDGGTF